MPKRQGIVISETIPPEQERDLDTWLNPTVILGSILIIPSPLSVIADRSNPTVVMGAIMISPSSAYTIAGILPPIVILSSTIAIPSPLAVISDRANPDVVLGSIAIKPAIAETRPSTKQFTYQLAGKIHRKYAPN